MKNLIKVILIFTFFCQAKAIFANNNIQRLNNMFNKKVYKTPIQYNIKFDNHTVIQDGDKVAVRLIIKTKKPKQPDTKIEVILIAKYRGNKIYRLWELTYPNWSNFKEFQ